MEFVDNTGHIFSLPSYKELPIGYEYEEHSYIFWIDSHNASKLSINNYYSKPIYALYELNKSFTQEELENTISPVLDIEIYIKDSNVFKLISPKLFQEAISNENFNLTDYIDLNKFDGSEEEFNFMKTSLTNDDLYCIKTFENLNNSTDVYYLMIPIYPIAMAKEAGTWITNIMIHIRNNSNDTDNWCYISVGGEFVNEYEELVINGNNMGISLPKDIMKSIYSESLYGDEFNTALYNEKLKEYLMNYMGIKGNQGNFKSAIDSLKWFGYGDKISISKLLRTDNEFKCQYIRDYFNLTNDVINSFKRFTTNSLISLMIYINEETGEQYPFNFNYERIFDGYSITREIPEVSKFYGENKPKMFSLLDNYHKIKIGNHDMPIENDDEKYWYWKPYFDFSFNELGIKLICLSYYYKKYFLPVHLYINSTSLGYRVFTNDIKLTTTVGYNISYPSIVLNDKNEVVFPGNGIHYFTKQIHYIDDNFNEYGININLENDNRNWYYINDTCVNIPIEFKNDGYYNCVLILQKSINNEIIYESHFSFYQNDDYLYKNFIIYPKKFNVKFEDIKPVTNFFEYWVDNEFTIKLLVNNKWYEYNFTLKINNPILEFGTLKYRYYLNDHNYLFSKINNLVDSRLHNIILCDSEDVDNIFGTIMENNEVFKNYISIEPNKGYNVHINNMPNNYSCYVLKYENYHGYNYYINWNQYINESLHCYVYYNCSDYSNLNINDFIEYDSLIHYISTDDLEENNSIILVIPQLWGIPLLIKNDLKQINSYIYSLYNLNVDKSYVETYDFDEATYIYQFFKSNYDILSPFKQIRGFDDTNKKVLFNSYMHNTQLVDMNNINFDINFNTILAYHLNHNLLYIDGQLLDGEFYQYILYTDKQDKYHKVYIHKNLIGNDITFNIKYIYDNEEILICAYKKGTIVLYETYNTENDKSYIISEDNIINDETQETITLLYDSLTNTYYSEAEENQTIYKIYDRLYSNTDIINSKYSTLVNLPNIPKYKNSMHLFGIYEKYITEKNVLAFYNNIDMFIDGIRFIHGSVLNIENEDQLKIYIEAKNYKENINNININVNIDTRYPDVYGLYWSTPVNSTGEQNKPLVPEEVISLNNSLGFYVKRDYSKYYNAVQSSKREIWELPNLYDFDDKEFTYYLDLEYTEIGSIIYESLDDFYKNNQYENQLLEEYKDLDILLKTENEEHIYYFVDSKVYDLDNIKDSKYYENLLYYEVYLLNSNGEEMNSTIRNIEDVEYDKIKIKFFYRKPYIVRNRFYMLNDYLIYLMNNNIDYHFNITLNDGIYYLNLWMNDTVYNIKLIQYNFKYMYIDAENNNVISNQNPSMYWYNADINNLESLPAYLNEIERYLYDDTEDMSIDSIKDDLDEYIELHSLYGRYAPDEIPARYSYRKFLSKDLTGLIGTYKMSLKTNLGNDIIKMIIEVIDENGNINNYDSLNEEIVFTGTEKKITLYLQISLSLNEEILYNENNLRSNKYFIPQLIKVSEEHRRLKYDYKLATAGNEYIKVNYLNKEFIYGDNSSEYIYDLYNKFFKLKFNIYDIYFKNKMIKPILLYSVYDYIDALNLHSYLNYDFYLMHDDEYWYGMYISQETCDNIKSVNDLKITKDEDKIKYVDEYILKYERSSEEYLLNRLEFNNSNGVNQFNDDDIISCFIYNNDRLPFNSNISSKWSITPMSLGMSNNTQFESNGEMTILSLPKNNSKYERGYYKVTVRYSLDRDIQHQFKNTSTIRVS